MAEKTNIEYEDIENLMLDPDNPRLPADLQGGSQKEIIQHIARHEAVEDLMAAIGRNGYFEGEPLVVYKATGERKWRVIEGNRRLTSVKLLRNPELYPARKTLAEIASDSPARNKPNRLPVVRVPTRAAALPYLGSRHIVGVKAWEPLPKARYMYQLFLATSSAKSPRERYRDVASQIGSGKRTDYIRANLNALAVFNLIKKNNFYGDAETDEMNFSFGVLYTALDRKPIAAHVGIIDYDAKADEAVKEYDPIVNPNTLKRDRVKELYEWAFKRDPDTGTTILGESRNISKLAEVLRSRTATDTLRKTKKLELAYERSDGISHEFSAALSRALEALRFANSMIANSSVDAVVVDLSSKILRQAQALHSAVQNEATSGIGRS